MVTLLFDFFFECITESLHIKHVENQKKSTCNKEQRFTNLVVFCMGNPKPVPISY